MIKNGLRNLLYHLKSDWLKTNNPTEYKEKEEICKEKLYGLVKDNIEFFHQYYGLSEVCLCISTYTLKKHKPSEICKLNRRFNDASTGLYGLQYDNETQILLTDNYGNTFKMLAHSPEGYSVDNYEFHIYTMTGHLLYEFSEPLSNDSFSSEHLMEIEKMRDYEKSYYKSVEQSKNRYKEICQYKDYIKVEYISGGYAHCIKQVTINKKIPITLTLNEIAKYADDWNYCFGGSISKIDEDDEYIKYSVRIHKD